MIWSSALLILLFLALWFAPILAIKAAERRGRSPSIVPWVVAPLYVLAVLVLATWWRVPFTAQAAVETAASSWAAAPQRPLPCSEVEAGAASLGRASRGQIDATTEGNLRLPADLWRRMPERERAALIEIATRMRHCMADGATAPGAAIYDIETNRILFESNSTAGR